MVIEIVLNDFNNEIVQCWMIWSDIVNNEIEIREKGCDNKNDMIRW